jgi:hypothetical protein
VAKPTVKAPALAPEATPVARSGTDLMRVDDLPEVDVAEVGPPPPRPPVEIPPLEPPKRNLRRLGAWRRDEDGGPEDDERDDDVRARPEAPRRHRRDESELSGAALFTPLADSGPELFTHGGGDRDEDDRDGGADRDDGRSRRTDDRAFNESLARARHGDAR